MLVQRSPLNEPAVRCSESGAISNVPLHSELTFVSVTCIRVCSTHALGHAGGLLCVVKMH